MEASADAPSEFEVTEDAEGGRFVLHRNGDLVGYADYRADDQRAGEGVIVVPYVETLPEYRGNGYAARLMDGLLAIIETDGRRIVPLCSFARGHILESPRHHHLLA